MGIGVGNRTSSGVAVAVSLPSEDDLKKCQPPVITYLSIIGFDLIVVW